MSEFAYFSTNGCFMYYMKSLEEAKLWFKYCGLKLAGRCNRSNEVTLF